MAGRRRLVMAATALGVAFLSTAPAGARTVTTMRTSINGHAVRGSTERHPVRVDPRHLALIDLTVHNAGRRAIDVSFVRLEGRVLGLTLMEFDTQVGMRVAAGATGVRRFRVDISAADDQAVGIIPGSVKLLDADHHVVLSEPLVFDVRGSTTSVYGLFGIGVAVVTLVSFLGALFALATGRLSPNRWWRATRFLTVGFGIGLTLVYALSATRIWAPTPARSGVVLVVSAAVLFVLGYITPTPGGTDHVDVETDDVEAGGPPPAATTVES